MPTHLPRPALRPIAICLSDAPVCPKCARVFMDVSVTADGSGMLYCGRKTSTHAGKQRCPGRAYVRGLDGEYCIVIGISAAEWEHLRSSRGRQILRDLGVFVEAVMQVNGGSE